jgi:TP901 family phage tail tape measure protein
MAERNLLIRIGAKASPSLKRTMNSINRSMSNAITKAAQFGKTFGLAIGGGVALGTREALSFEKKMREVSTMLGDQIGLLDEYNVQLKKMSVDTGKAPEELAEGLRQVLSAGIPAAEAMQFLDTANRGAIGGVAETVEAVDLLTGVINGYQLEASEAGRISDIVFQSIKDGKTTYSELAKNMGEVIPFAAQLGVSLEDLFASVTTLTKGSIETVKATTFLKNVMNQVITASDGQQKAAQSMGIAFDSASIKAMGFGNWLNQIREKAGGSDEKLKQLFPSIRAITAVLSLTGKQASEFARIQDNMSASTGAASEAFDRMQKGPAAQVEKTFNAIKVAGIEIGQNVIPQLGKAIEALGGPSKIAKGIGTIFNDMAAGLKKIADVIGSSVILQNLFELGERTGSLLSGGSFVGAGLGQPFVDTTTGSAGINVAGQAAGTQAFNQMQRQDPRFQEGTGAFNARQKALTTSDDLMDAFGFAVDNTLMNVKHNVAVSLKKRQGAEAVASGL